MSHPTASRPGEQRRRVLGWLCLVPAVGVGVWQLLVPSAQTVIGSFYRSRLGSGGGEFVGLRGYEALPELVRPLLLGALIGLPGFVIAGGLGVLVGGLAARSTGPLRLAVRILLGMLLVSYAPIGIALALRTDARGELGLGTLLYGVVVAALPLVFGVSAAIVMAVDPFTTARPEPTGRVGGKSGLTLVMLLVVGLLTAVATGIQLLGMPLAMTGGGPRNTTQTPGLLIYQLAARQFALDRAFAISTVLLVVLALLGVLVTVLLVTSPLRVEFRPLSGSIGRGSVVFGIVGLGVAALVLVAAVGLLFAGLARSWVAGLFVLRADGLGAEEWLRIVLNTWLPALIAVVGQLVVGGLAAFGIAVLRPLGDRSRRLLLVFAPGLFVGLTPLLAVHLESLIRAGRLGAPSSVPPVLLSIPILFVLAFVFAGLRRAWVGERTNHGPVLLAGAGAVVLVGVVSLVLVAQQLSWNLLVARGFEDATGPLVLLQLVATAGAADGLPQQLATPIPVLVGLGVLAAAALVALDRVVLRTGPNVPGSA